MQLTTNFSLSEFIESPTARRHGIDNRPSEEVIKNIKTLCEKVLQPLRNYLKVPIVITSGYRSPRLNQLVGGVPNSQHVTGEAADFKVPGKDHLEIVRWMDKNLMYDQLILEFYNGGSTGWIHVSYSRNKNRKENLIIGEKIRKKVENF